MSLSRKMFDDVESFVNQPLGMGMGMSGMSGMGMSPQMRGNRMFDILGGMRNDFMDQVQQSCMPDT